MGRNNWQTFNWTFFPWWETNRHKVRWFFCARVYTKYQRKFQSMLDLHDEAPPQFSRVARQFLNQHFANKWIGPIAWPARSLDLNPLDFHSWEHLKSFVYATSIENAEILRNRIEQGFRQIRETPGMIEYPDEWQDACRLLFKCKVVISNIFCKSN